MRHRPLGPSGINASVVALGTWVMGGWMWGGSDEDDSIQAIHAALDAGVNFLDTAPIYGFGVSETIVGKAIQGRRDKVVLATKCAMVANTRQGDFKFSSDAQGPNPHGLIDIYVHNHPDSIRLEVERSLKRLQTDYIDLYQTHWQDPTTPIADTMGALLDLKQQGKIRAIGVCNATPEQMDEYRALGQLDTDQERYSMLRRELEARQLPYLREHGIALLAYSPLALGLLSGKVGPDRVFPEGDQRRTHPLFTPENRQRVAEMLDRFRPIAEAHGVSIPQLVVAWTIHQPGVTHALVGARTPTQARENAAAGDVELSADELAVMAQAIDAYAAAAA